LKITEWIDKNSFLKLAGIYVATMIGVFILGIVIFFFPILPIYSALGKEFSNLGPIATGLWGVIFDLVVVTPAFFFILILKYVRANQKGQRG
jgi:hypothetical protein